METMKLGLSDIACTVRTYPLLLSGLLLFWVWQLSFFQGPSFVLSKPALLPEAFPAIAPFVGAAFFAYLAAALFWRRAPILYGAKGFDAACTLALSLGVVMTILLPLAGIGDDTEQLACFVIGSVAMGVGSALFNMQIGFTVARIPQRLVPYASVIPIVGGSMVLAVIMRASTVAQCVILVLLPIGFVLLLRRARSARDARRYYRLGADSRPKPPRRYFATAFMHGISMGILFSLLALEPVGELGPVLQPASFLVGAALVALCVYKLRMDYNGLLYKIGIPLLSLGLLMMALLPDVGLVGGAVYLVGYCFINVIMMCLNMYFVAGLGFSPVYIIGFSTLAMVLGQVIGIALGPCLSFVLGPDLAVLLMGCGIAFALPVAALYCLDEKNMLSGWGSVKIERGEDRPRDHTLRLVSVEYGLSGRETDVLELVARGNTRKVVASSLHLSEDTVKTYLKTLYAKLGVHTKQEVLDLLEQKERER